MSESTVRVLRMVRNGRTLRKDGKFHMIPEKSFKVEVNELLEKGLLVKDTWTGEIKTTKRGRMYHV